MPRKFSVVNFIAGQWATWPQAPQANLQGKTVIVTGSNIGIGYETAKHFARMSPGKLIMACRNRDKAQAALEALKAETGCQTAEVWTVDLGSFDSVKAFANKFNKECTRLDILVENAAVIPDFPHTTTSDGWETTFQVNNLSTSLLGLLLLPRMIETAEKFATTPRLVLVSSDLHLVAKFGPEMMDAPNPLEKFGKDPHYIPKVLEMRYHDSKLLNTFFARALGDRIPENKVIVNSVNPGYVYSNLRSGFTGFRKVMDAIREKALARTTEEGSRHVVWAAVGGTDLPKEDMQGGYVHMCGLSESSAYVASEQGRRHQDILWDNLIDILAKVEPQVRKTANDYLSQSS